MPTAYIKKLSDQGKGSVESLEKKWNHAKSLAKEAGHAEEFDYITGIFNKMIKESNDEKFSLAKWKASGKAKGKRTSNALFQYDEEGKLKKRGIDGDTSWHKNDPTKKNESFTVKDLLNLLNEKVIAYHPASEKHAIHITDVHDKNEFSKKWEKEPNHIQNEFGWELPLHNQSKFTPKKKVDMNYKDYVKLVDNHSKQ
jgi:hypothetical protein